MVARRRAHGAMPVPLGNGKASRYTRSGCLVAERPVVAGVQPSLRYRGSGPAIHGTGRRWLAGQRLHDSVFSRGAHTVPPMPVVTCVSNRSECAPHQLTGQVTGSVSHGSDRASRRSGPAGKARCQVSAVA